MSLDSPLRGAASLDRGLTLLTLIARAGGTAPLSALAAELGLPLSTARRLAAMLERHGLVTRVARGRLAGGAHLLTLARAVDERNLLVRAARPVLRALARDSGATAHLGVLDGGMVTYLIKEQGGGAAVVSREGLQLEAYCTAIGKMLLASLPEKALEAYLGEGPFVALTERTIVDPDLLRLELAQTRARGYAREHGEIVDGLGCLAFPITRRGEPPHAAVSIACTGLSDMSVDAQVFEATRRAAAEISGRLY